MALHYLIDGFNLLYALPEMPPGSWESKRLHLLRLLETQKPYGKNAITVVFDSREGQGDQSLHGPIQVVYTAGETADDWISHYVRQVKNPRILVVVSDDQGLQRLIRGTGARHCSTKEFMALNAKKEPPSAGNRTPRDADDITDEMKKKWL